MYKLTNNPSIIQIHKEAFMNRQIAALMLAGAFSFPLVAHTFPTIGSHPPILIQGRLNSPYISHHGGTAYLQLTITTPTVGSTLRRPINLSVVLDRSGSMGDEKKIDYAKKALNRLIDQLDSEDILSIVIYDDVIEVLRDARPVGNSKMELKRLVERVYPRGSTNLGGGMMEGFRQVDRYLKKEYANRVVLLSDGLANQGVTDPYQLNRIARQYRAKSISLTTMGVGLDYNENLMVGLAENGGGNYYFIESPNSLASILNKEFNLLSSLVAQNASIELSLGRNVRLQEVIGCEHQTHNDRYIIPVGDLYSNDRREITLELLVPGGAGSLTVASGTLRYESEQQWGSGFPVFATTVTYTRDVAEIEKNRDLDAQAKADIAVSTRTVNRALQALDEGRTKDAEKAIHEAKEMLNASPAAASMGAGGASVREQAGKLGSFNDLLKDSSDARKAKKAIQYENYRTQKSK